MGLASVTCLNFMSLYVSSYMSTCTHFQAQTEIIYPPKHQDVDQKYVCDCTFFYKRVRENVKK